MILRAWEEKDVDTIAEMEKRCFPQDAWTKGMLSELLDSPYEWAVLAEEGGQVCGYCVLSVLFEDAEVLNIAVAPAYRKQGYGKLLMETMLEKARSLNALQCFLEVRESNTPAIRLYESYGFAQYGVRKRYYEDGENALVMKKIF